MRLPALSPAILACWLFSAASAQTTAESWSLAFFGYLDSIPDIDGDGFREVVHGDIQWEPAGVFGSSYGRVVVVSGLSKQVLWEYHGTRTGQAIGSYLRNLGDVNGDGFPDVGTSGDRHSYLLSGRDGTLLYRTPTGWTCLEPLGDFNGDDYDDVLLAGTWVLAGGSFEFILGPTAGSANCAVLGDLDGDRVPEYAVGFGLTFPFGQGQVIVYSGKSGEVLHHLYSENTNSKFGRALAGLGDFTGDGVPDFAVGESESRLPNGNYDVRGTVYFFDGKTGDEVARVQGPNTGESFFGGRVAPAGDVNGNGTDDILVGFGNFSIYVVDGATRKTIFDFEGDSLTDFRGDGIDWTGDDIPDFLVSKLFGTKELVSGAAIGTTVRGRGCARPGVPVPRIGTTGSAEIGSDLPVHLSRVAPGDRAILLLGDVGPGSFGEPIRKASFDCGVGVSVNSWIATVAERVRPGEGAATVELPIVDDPSLVGSVFFAQWLVFGREGEGRGVKAASRSLRIRILAPSAARAALPSTSLSGVKKKSR